ncbi:5-bromo-4-chloroindolyl phosphate hydrolysis family protein [Dinoroseobacter sp. S375]|uniref:5-bromo-4-chloroindolyl phosphate hydrolysis family protein n=1 Tax=Dinoroseobacter sp. S375 TaxID=3415136 RepID=UPI003C7B2B6E
MSRRYGGKYSPDASGSGPDAEPAAAPRPRMPAKRSRTGARVNAMFFLPLPLALTAFGKDATGMVLSLVALGLLLGGAWMLREGLLAEEAYDARKVAKRPALPRKIFAAVLAGAGLALAGLSNEIGVLGAGLLAVAGAGLHLAAFGIDPLSDKGAEGVDAFQTERVARVVDEAEAYLKAMSDAILRAGDRALELQVDQFAATARDMCRRVEEDPRDLTAARKYLGVYLMGARDATVKFADLYGRTRDAGARQDYVALLKDLEANFASKTDALLLEDRTDLDVEIEVLRDRLAREGVRA